MSKMQRSNSHKSITSLKIKRQTSDLGPRRIKLMCDKSGEPIGTSWDELGEYFEWYIEEINGLHKRTYSDDLSLSDYEF